MSNHNQTPNTRLAPQARRDQLLAAAGQLLTQGGIENIRIPLVAQAAGVSRPVVYRFFENRERLIVGILEDLVADLEMRLMHRLMEGPKDMEGLARALADACCQSIEVKGAGPWRLLGASEGDPKWTQITRNASRRLIEPWLPRIANMTGSKEAEARAAIAMVVASSRAAIGLWLNGHLTRDAAVEAVVRGVSALLGAFSSGGQKVETLWQEWAEATD